MQAAIRCPNGPTTVRLAGMTVVATCGPTSIRSASVATEPMKHRNVRMDDRTWLAAARVAELKGQRISDLVRSLLRGVVTRNRKLLENDPVWQETCLKRGWVE